MIKAIVTGHSRGLGAAVAADMAGRGIAVLGLSRQPHPDLAVRHPGLLREVALDLSDEAALQAWCAGPDLAAHVAQATLVLLVNNAGTVRPIGAPGRQGADTIARAIALNVAAPLMLVDALVAATGGEVERRVVHVSSGAARNPYAGWSVYGATKAALDQHARACQLDHVPHLHVASLAPGVVDTDMQGELRACELADFPQRERFDALKRDGALAAPAAVAHKLVSYLLSPAFGNEPVADLRTIDLQHP